MTVSMAVRHRLLSMAIAYWPHGSRPRQRKVHPPADDQAHELWYFLDDHSDVIFPLLGLAIVALIVFGIRHGMTSNVAELRKKQERKDAIVRMMRSKLLVTADAVSGELGIDHFSASALLDDLVKEGKLIEQKSSGGVANYRLKGL
jgi:hypothetical protein